MHNLASLKSIGLLGRLRLNKHSYIQVLDPHRWICCRKDSIKLKVSHKWGAMNNKSFNKLKAIVT